MYHDLAYNTSTNYKVCHLVQSCVVSTSSMRFSGSSSPDCGITRRPNILVIRFRFYIATLNHNMQANTTPNNGPSCSLQCNLTEWHLCVGCGECTFLRFVSDCEIRDSSPPSTIVPGPTKGSLHNS